jgi:hypothetical protein
MWMHLLISSLQVNNPTNKRDRACKRQILPVCRPWDTLQQEDGL